jgi:hypothetical protein
MLVLLISCIFIYLILGKRENIKSRVLKIITVFVALIPGLLLVDTFARLATTPTYFSTQQIGLRVADNRHKVTIKDIPKAVRTYPRPAPGYPALECTVTMDGRGFRNQFSLEKYDFVALGDSFTEGFYVSDEQPWPVVFSAKSKLSVYNLGMSGANPFLYLQALKKIGQYLAPKIAICMLTEISDFETGISEFQLKSYNQESSSNQIASHKKDLQPLYTPIGDRIKGYYLQSPLRTAYDNLFKRYLTRINIHKYEKDVDILSWIPVEIPKGADSRFYNFTPGRLLEFYTNREIFSKSRGWESTVFALTEMKRICREANIRFIVAYAPDKIHVVLPLVKPDLPADKVRAFASLKTSKKLPPAAEFIDILFRGLEVQEAVVSEFCKKNSIEFISTTQELRKRVSQGKQMYFTYDTHWTPLGHRAVAEVIYQYWLQQPK